MLAAASELLLERGVDGTTLAAIGERAGYSRGLATYRFGSKAGLLDAVCRTVARRWLRYLDAEVGAKVGIDAMCSALDAYRRFVTESPDDARILQLLYGHATTPRQDMRETARETYSRQLMDVEDWLSRGIDAGAVRDDIDPGVVAAQFVAHFAGLTQLWLIVPDAIEFDVVHANYKEQLRRHLERRGRGIN